MFKDLIDKIDRFVKSLGDSISGTVNDVGGQVNTELNEGLTELGKNVDKMLTNIENKTSDGVTVTPVSEADNTSADVLVSFDNSKEVDVENKVHSVDLNK